MTNFFVRSLGHCQALGAVSQNKCNGRNREERRGSDSVLSACAEIESVTTSDAMSWFSGSAPQMEEDNDGTTITVSCRPPSSCLPLRRSSTSKLYTANRTRRNRMEDAGNSSNSQNEGGCSKMSTSSSATSLTSLSSFSTSSSSSASPMISSNLHAAPRLVISQVASSDSVTSTENDWPELVVDAPPQGMGNRSRRSSLCSSSSSVSALSCFSSSSPEDTSGPRRTKGLRKTVRFQDVVKVRFVSWGEQDRDGDHRGSRIMSTDDPENAVFSMLWHTREEEVLMKQQPIDTLEDVLRRAISMSAVSRNDSRENQRQNTRGCFESLLKELEQSGSFSARGLESSLRDIFAPFGLDSQDLSTSAVVTAVLIEQDRLRNDQETMAPSLDSDDLEEWTMALGNTSRELSRPFRKVALRQGHLDAAEETNSRLSAGNTRVEERRKKLWQLRMAEADTTTAKKGSRRRNRKEPSTTAFKHKPSRQSFRAGVRDVSPDTTNTRDLVTCCR